MKSNIFVDESMLNLTCASNDAASLSSSSNMNEIGTTMIMYPHPTPQMQQQQQQQQSFGNSVPMITTNNQNQSSSNKKKRNLPGNPDPEAEVIALSPKSLMATNKFMCEICNKGFQRDQNLQLHRRGHNLPWKLKQKSKLEVVRKKVYVCPEASCVHHEPSRALGDLTGIKKHFSRKHGEKKWKCEKCSKRYAVQSDWKAHSKICGTREYRCDCGTLFSRRDSFITHRAFCDALAEETAARSSSSTTLNNHLPLHSQINFPLKTEPQLTFNIGSNSPHHNHQLSSWLDHHNQNPNLDFQLTSPSDHMSATALLQKAAQMGVTMTNNGSHQTLQHGHMCAPLLSNCMDQQQLLLHPNSLTSTSVGSMTNVHEITQMILNSRKDHGDDGGELTRDFLGVRGLVTNIPDEEHFLNMGDQMAGLDYMSRMNSNQIPWQG